MVDGKPFHMVSARADQLRARLPAGQPSVLEFPSRNAPFAAHCASAKPDFCSISDEDEEMVMMRRKLAQPESS